MGKLTFYRYDPSLARYYGHVNTSYCICYDVDRVVDCFSCDGSTWYWEGVLARKLTNENYYPIDVTLEEFEILLALEGTEIPKETRRFINEIISEGID